jgi:hypothetical protein
LGKANISVHLPAVSYKTAKEEAVAAIAEAIERAADERDSAVTATPGKFKA